MTTPHDNPLNRLGAAVRADQARELADQSELRRLEAQAEGLTARRHHRSRRRWIPAFAALAVGLTAIMLVVAWPRTLSFKADGVDIGPGTKLAASTERALPLRFSDGSVVTLAPGSHGEVVAVSARGASVHLDSGRLEAAVVHAQRTRWVVGVGPYGVQVTGTRFSASWDAVGQKLAVALTEGSVIVQGPLLGAAGLPLRRGQVLSVDVGKQRVSLAPVEELPPPNIAPPASALAPVPEPPAAVEPSEWKRWALASHPKRAYAAAARVGFNDLCRMLPAPDLLLLADAARFAGEPGSARQVFQALRARFPTDTRAGDAVFGLGILARDAGGQPRVAVRRFEEYLSRWPAGALAREARGRLIEAWEKAGRHGEARRAAARYLAEHPDGPHAAFARRLLQRDRP
ncbi:MAG TPA: FecR domain-containing protein [Polyangia bacterium]|nr:FecR domain-containing protein [Polyangia bacterium]